MKKYLKTPPSTYDSNKDLSNINPFEQLPREDRSHSLNQVSIELIFQIIILIRNNIHIHMHFIGKNYLQIHQNRLMNIEQHQQINQKIPQNQILRKILLQH